MLQNRVGCNRHHWRMAAPQVRGGIGGALAHPAMLLVVAAVLTGLLVPWITNRWEERDKAVAAARAAEERELAIKVDLVTAIGSSTARFLAAVEAAGGRRTARVDEAYEAFQTSSLETSSKLAAYFREPDQLEAWTNFVFTIRNVYALLGTDVGRPRNRLVSLLSRYFRVQPVSLDGLCFATTSPHFTEDLRELVLKLQGAELRIVDRVAARSPTLSPHDSAATRFQPVARAAPLGARASQPCDRYFGGP